MIEVEMSKDIRDYEPKIVGPFTKRQLLCLGIGFGYGIPIFFLLPDTLETVFRIIIPIVAAAPAFACGWLDMFGYHVERFAIHIIKNVLLRSRYRLYEGSNLYEDIEHELFGDEKPPTPTSKNSKIDLTFADAPATKSVKAKTEKPVKENTKKEKQTNEKKPKKEKNK